MSPASPGPEKTRMQNWCIGSRMADACAGTAAATGQQKRGCHGATARRALVAHDRQLHERAVLPVDAGAAEADLAGGHLGHVRVEPQREHGRVQQAQVQHAPEARPPARGLGQAGQGQALRRAAAPVSRGCRAGGLWALCSRRCACCRRRASGNVETLALHAQPAHTWGVRGRAARRCRRRRRRQSQATPGSPGRTSARAAPAAAVRASACRAPACR